MSLVAISQSLSFARPDKFTILCLNVGVLYQVIQSDLFWDGDPWPFPRLSDLQLGDKKVTFESPGIWPNRWSSLSLFSGNLF